MVGEGGGRGVSRSFATLESGVREFSKSGVAVLGFGKSTASVIVVVISALTDGFKVLSPGAHADRIRRIPRNTGRITSG